MSKHNCWSGTGTTCGRVGDMTQDEVQAEIARWEKVARWDEWFMVTKDVESLKAWLAARQVHTDPAVLETWATIIELNRIDKLQAEKVNENSR